MRRAAPRPRPQALLALTALTATVLASGAVLGPGSRAVADETVPAPTSGPLTVEGHGWGHGHGLSQYGALGAALRGQTATQIDNFYFPGTRFASIGNPAIRIKLTRYSDDAGAPLIVSGAAGLAVQGIGTGAITKLPDQPMWRVLYDGSQDAPYRVQYLDGKTWKDQLTSTVPVQFRGPSSIRVWYAGAGTTDFTRVPSRSYHGAVRIVVSGSTAVKTDVTGMQSYLRGVVPRESPASWPSAALKAQAVAARSYAAYKRAHRRSWPFDVYDSSYDQVFGGVCSYATAGSACQPQEDGRTNAAVAATAGQVRAFAGQPIFAQFSSSNGGYTAAGSQPYLAARPDPWERFSGNPYEDWKTSVDITALERWTGLATITEIQVHREDSGSGHVDTVQFTGATASGAPRSVARTGEQVRGAFGWRSTYFSFVPVSATPAVAAVIGSDGIMRVRRGGGSWRGMSGHLVGAPVVVARGRRHFYLAEGTDRNVWIRTDTVGWRRFGAAGTVCRGVGASIFGSYLTVACRARDDSMHVTRILIPSGIPRAGQWRNFGGRITSAPAVAVVGGRTTFFTTGRTGHAYTRTSTDRWRKKPWQCVDGESASTVSATGATYWTCRSPSHSVVYAVHTHGAWSPLHSLGGSPAGRPAVAAASTPSFAVKHQNGSVWMRSVRTQWTRYGGHAMGGVGLTPR